MRSLSILLAALLSVAFALPAHADTTKRVVVYYQTQYSNGTYVSPLPLLTNNTGVTDVEVAAVHLDDNSVVHLNDDPPDSAKFTQMWQDLGTMQAQGVHVLAMVGGAAQGSFQRLDTQFDTYYPLLHNLITTYHLDGVDLDVEEDMSLAGMERLVDQLRTDFGAGFEIALAPVASALDGGGNLSGFSYDSLMQDRGSSISFLNAQFYSGFGSMATTDDYESILGRGLVPASKLVAGTLTSSDNGSGFVPIETVQSTVRSLVSAHSDFGGVAGWEYFNSLPGGPSAPWQWATAMSTAQQ